MNLCYPNMIVLGSTGSVGEQAIDVAERLNIGVDAISAHKNVKRAEEQARKYKVKACAMADENAAVVAINGGGFIDPNYNSLGGVPQGIVIKDGKEMSLNIKASVISLAVAIIALAKRFYEHADAAERLALLDTLVDVLKGR